MRRRLGEASGQETRLCRRLELLQSQSLLRRALSEDLTKLLDLIGRVGRHGCHKRLRIQTMRHTQLLPLRWLALL